MLSFKGRRQSLSRGDLEMTGQSCLCVLVCDCIHLCVCICVSMHFRLSFRCMHAVCAGLLVYSWCESARELSSPSGSLWGVLSCKLFSYSVSSLIHTSTQHIFLFWAVPCFTFTQLHAFTPELPGSTLGQWAASSPDEDNTPPCQTFTHLLRTLR